ncbi:MAG: hypothetical protein ACQERZ_02375 [Fusobacteriota bacterium]
MNIKFLLKKERIIWMGIIVILIIIDIVVLFKYQKREIGLTKKISNLENKIENLEQKEKMYNSKIKDLKIQVDNKEYLIESMPYNNSRIINNLKRKGYKKGVDGIIEDLIENNDIIPYEGVLGGNMNFYNENRIFVLSDKWVMAYFDDGHIAGNLLLKYDLTKNKVNWKVIDSYLFE